MSLTAALAGYFSRSSRGRGDDYLARGRVRVISASSTVFEAGVRGTYDYHVVIARENRPNGTVEFGASCDCPVVLDHGTGCKHIWAALGRAERDGHLQAGQPLRADRARLDVIPPGDDAILDALDAEDDDPENDDDLDDDFGLSRLTYARPRTGSRPPPPDPMQVQLGLLTAAIDDRDRRHARTAGDAADPLLYVLDRLGVRTGRGVAVYLVTRRQKKDGGWTKPKPRSLTAAAAAGASEPDRGILALLFGASRAYGAYGLPDLAYDVYGAVPSSAFALNDVLVRHLVPAMAATGRLYQREAPDAADLSPLAWDDGPAATLVTYVERTETGYRLSAALQRAGQPLAMDGVVFSATAGLLLTRTTAMRFQAGPEAALATSLASTGAMTFDAAHARALAPVLARGGVAPESLPDELRLPTVDVDPRPHLEIAPSQYSPQVLIGQASFDYDGARVSPDPPVAVSIDEASGRVIRRRPAVERASLDMARDAGFQGAVGVDGTTAMSIDVRRFAAAVRTLIGTGWIVTARGRIYRAAGQVSLSVSSGIDWFDLDGRVAFDDTDVALTEVLSALRRGEPTVALGDGSIGLLPEDWLRRYGALASTGEVRGDVVRFGRVQAALLDALLAEREQESPVRVDEAFARIRAEVARGLAIDDAEPPGTFEGTLRGYQKHGLGWFLALRRLGFGGCLADDMGLGKTVMVLALLAWWQQARASEPDAPRTSVIVLPRSLVHNWMAEAARFAPSLRVIDYSGAGRRAADAGLGEADVVLVTYGTVRRDVDRLKDVAFEYVIVDEAQAIKNAATVSAKAVRLLRGRHRLALTGTPVENHLGEVWSLFEFLNPGLLGASTVFQRAAATATPDPDAVALLARGLRPFLLRRTKNQVASDLPAKTEQTMHCELPPRQRAFYEEVRREVRRSLQERIDRVGLGRSQMHVLEALLRLRQAACHPGLIDPARLGDESAKIDMLLPRLAEVADEGHKALVFSQFTSLLAIVRARLDEDGRPYEYLDGRTRDRESRVRRFQDDADCRLFLVSLKAGGVGLNLTAAEYVFLLDPWWNPAVEAQAIDRTHRIGQTREVFAYRLIAKDTVEEKVLELQTRKRALADAVLAADAVGLRQLSRDDLELLLS